MTGFPWYLFLVFGLFGAYYLWSRKRLAGAMAANADKTVDAVAARLGLTVMEGDGKVNLLYFQQPSGDFSRRIVAQGQPYGRTVSLTIFDGQQTSEYLVARTIRTTFGAFFAAQTQINLPPFELSLRNPNQYIVPQLDFAERPELQTVGTGDPELDALFVIRAADPRLGPALIPALKLLSTQLCVHLAGEGNTVWMSFPRVGLAYLGSGPEEFLLALEAAACGLEGRPAPTALSGVLPAAPLGARPA